MEPASVEDEAELRGQAQIWRHALSFIDHFAMKCAVELRLADIIHSHGPLSLSQLASRVGPCPPADTTCLARIMRLLVRRNIFTASANTDHINGETLYGPSGSSKWLLRDSEETLAPLILLQSNPHLLNSWRCLDSCVKRGGSAFNNFHGQELWEVTSQDPELNSLFNEAMACASKITVGAVLSGYKDGFGSINGTLVDVGGGTGEVLAQIVKAFPHINGVNFDLPHVIASAPIRNGVAHVGGDMFDAIPCADAVLVHWTMHNWSDEHCVKLLQNCWRAISGKSGGKAIIVDIVVKEDGEDPKEVFESETSLLFDLMMMAYTQGGMERSEIQWKKVLEKGGFPRYKIIQIPALLSIIEAFPL